MSLWADDYQDALEWAIIPFLAYQVIHLSFAELWLASGYTLYVEALGHSGIRAYWPHPLLTPVLKPFGMELAIEDHDLHHRYGRGGKNYGKQTRVWDVVFGTVAPREEEIMYTSSHGS
jgi:sterol desaturase/sphingolipid hydroxylase (fatty acid hydroxylase superfamily)